MTAVERRKRAFLDGLEARLCETLQAAGRAELSAAGAAAEMQAEARRREDAKEAALQARLASGHRGRRERALEELEVLRGFARKALRPFARGEAVALGALVDVAVEGPAGVEERSLFLLPVGAGEELHGPDGDGFVSVATPASPVGRALLGARVGDTVEVVVGGSDSEWTVVDLC